MVYKGIFLKFLNSLKLFLMSFSMYSSFSLILMSTLGSPVCNFSGQKLSKSNENSKFENENAYKLANAVSINSCYTSQIIEEHAGDKHPKHVGNKTEFGLLGLLLHLCI